MDCQFCKKQFSTKGNLINHQRSTKYCIKIQESEKPMLEFICHGCDKRLSSNQSLKNHYKTCKKYPECDKIRQLERQIETLIEQHKITIAFKDSIIEKLEKSNENLQEKLMQIAMRTNKTTTNIISNIQQNFTPITDERLLEDSTKLTLDHLVGGGEAIANIFLEGSLKNNAICTDVSRKILHLKNENGKLVKDVNAGTITKRAFSSMLKIAREIKNKYGEGIDAKDDDQIEMFGKIMSVVGEMAHAISGQSNEVSSDFAKAVCIGSII